MIYLEFSCVHDGIAFVTSKKKKLRKSYLSAVWVGGQYSLPDRLLAGLTACLSVCLVVAYRAGK